MASADAREGPARSVVEPEHVSALLALSEGIRFVPDRVPFFAASETTLCPATPCGACTGAQGGGEDVDGGGLPRSVGAEQPQDGAGLDREGRPAQGLDLTEALLEPFGRAVAHAGSGSFSPQGAPGSVDQGVG